MNKKKYLHTMQEVEMISSQIGGEAIYSVRELVDEVCAHTGIIEGYLYGATPTQLIKDPETLDHFINYLGDLTGRLSTKAAELDQRVPELKTLITEARALADREGAGNVEE